MILTVGCGCYDVLTNYCSAVLKRREYRTSIRFIRYIAGCRAAILVVVRALGLQYCTVLYRVLYERKITDYDAWLAGAAPGA